jgi:hypothetical protein
MNEYKITQIKNVSSNHSTCDDYLTLLRASCPTIVLDILSFLPTQDLHTVESTDKEFNFFIAENDKMLFSNCLRNDFDVGKVLVETVETAMSSCTVTIYGGIAPETPYKKMYLAFRNRYRLHERESSIALPWNKPPEPLPLSLFQNTLSDEIVDKFYDDDDYEREDSDGTDTTMITDDVNALVFILTIGKDAVGLMEWEPWRTGSKLVLNKKQEHCYDWLYNIMDIPKLDDEAIEMIATYDDMVNDDDVLESERTNQFEEVKSKLRDHFCYSLHAVDVQRFQVMTIVQDNPAGVLDIDRPSCFSFTNCAMKCPYLIGVDSESYESETEGNPDMDSFHQLTSLLHIDTRDYPGVYLDGMNIHLADGMEFDDLPAYVACNLYRKLMKRNCVDYGGFPTVPFPTILRRREVRGGDLRIVRQQLQIASVMNKIRTDQRLDDEINVTGTDHMDESSGHKIGNKRGFSDDRFCDSKDNKKKNKAGLSLS